MPPLGSISLWGSWLPHEACFAATTQEWEPPWWGCPRRKERMNTMPDCAPLILVSRIDHELLVPNYVVDSILHEPFTCIICLNHHGKQLWVLFLAPFCNYLLTWPKRWRVGTQTQADWYWSQRCSPHAILPSDPVLGLEGLLWWASKHQVAGKPAKWFAAAGANVLCTISELLRATEDVLLSSACYSKNHLDLL